MLYSEYGLSGTIINAFYMFHYAVIMWKHVIVFCCGCFKIFELLCDIHVGVWTSVVADLSCHTSSLDQRLPGQNGKTADRIQSLETDYSLI